MQPWLPLDESVNPRPLTPKVPVLPRVSRSQKMIGPMLRYRGHRPLGVVIELGNPADVIAALGSGQQSPLSPVSSSALLPMTALI
ncbi:hypothetical protein M513_10631 [Trichuris suis]|uniref:Uncharacterized protein n=1 Tax=Trichuris suis TaxID=68888 RepID=A0A085LU51_9BILA|nr:hypothetical protein M513_10631 [Trichuris suis]